VIVHKVTQGSPEWLALRCGIPTASCFDKIVTAKTRVISRSSDKYFYELCASWLLGQPVDSASSGFMQRGSEMEAEAVNWYAFSRDVEPQAVGFVTNDDGTIGCSPDRLIGEDGLLEVKCLSAVQHVAALLGEADEYALQIQGQLWLTERAWADRLYYSPAMPPVVQRVERDVEMIELIAANVEAFAKRLANLKAELVRLGCKLKDHER
jgi:hypothetical protein